MQHTHYKVSLAIVPAQPIAVVRRHASILELPTVVPQACGEVWQFVREHKLTGVGRNVALYLDDEINFECGVEVPWSFAGGEGAVARSATPGGRVAVTDHFGPYAGLVAAHVAVRAWCAEHGYALAGPNWEIYGPWTEDESRLQTRVSYLLK